MEFYNKDRFDFDELTERRGSDCMKWDGEGDSPDVIPLWVADMDFRTAPDVRDAVVRRAESGIFGYTSVPSSYYDSLCGWFSRRHGWEIDRDMVIYTSGVVPAISAIIKALTKPGEGVILQTPAYNCFFSSIRNNGCKVVENPLIRQDMRVDRAYGKDGWKEYSFEEQRILGFGYNFNFKNIEELAAKPENTLLILCNPHNPTGRVWSRQELEAIADICHRNGVRVVSDEIHCELVHPGPWEYVPYATVDPDAVVCVSPSKAFNIAGLQIANIVCPDSQTRTLIDRAINDNEVCDVNPFGVVALQAAYEKGGEWLDALIDYLDLNYSFLHNIFQKRLPRFPMAFPQATYLAWVDISATGLHSSEVVRILLEEAKVRVASGEIYGDSHFIRINYACPRRRLLNAIERMVPVLARLVEERRVSDKKE